MDRIQMTKGRAQIVKKNTITKTVIGGEMEKRKLFEDRWQWQ